MSLVFKIFDGNDIRMVEILYDQINIKVRRNVRKISGNIGSAW